MDVVLSIHNNPRLNYDRCIYARNPFLRKQFLVNLIYFQSEVYIYVSVYMFSLYLRLVMCIGIHPSFQCRKCHPAIHNWTMCDVKRQSFVILLHKTYIGAIIVACLTATLSTNKYMTIIAYLFIYYVDEYLGM